MARKEGAISGADEDAYHEKLREENQNLKKVVYVPGIPIKKKPKVVKF